ncbi:MAG: hypothetical protein PVSMB8_02580 [Vulcanimicrobiaceae bacterium]
MLNRVLRTLGVKVESEPDLVLGRHGLTILSVARHAVLAFQELRQLYDVTTNFARFDAIPLDHRLPTVAREEGVPAIPVALHLLEVERLDQDEG